MNSSFAYAVIHPLTTSAQYPYSSGSGVTGKCNTVLESQGKYGVRSYVDVAEGDCQALAEAVVGQPVSVAVDALAWQFYVTGILPHGVCGHNLDHGVLLTGYGDNYWLIKNSWGSGWGKKGYIQIARDGANSDNAKSDTCGVCLAASYPLVPS
jgi:C1A family cysteine protease